MAAITIIPSGPRAFEVQLSEGERRTTHRVTVPDSLGDECEARTRDSASCAGRDSLRRRCWIASNGSPRPIAL